MSYSTDHSRVLPPDSKLFHEIPPGRSCKSSTKSGKVSGKLQFCLKFAAFVFSHVGLGFLVLVYTVLGALLFRHFEESTVPHTISLIADIRNSTVNKLWTETYKLNVLYKENWTAMATKEIEQFQRVLVKALKEGYLPGEESKFHSRWSFTDSWMYSISIITTIGYANRPATSEGKIATMLYALFGIPIMLLFLSTIGSLLGRGLKSLYRFCCNCNTETHNSLVNVQGHEHHHHHLHEDYQVHHIPLSSINGGGHLPVACEQSLPSDHTFPAKNVPLLNASYHPRCSYETEFVELEAETKLCPDPIDHLCSDKGTHCGSAQPHCKYLTAGIEAFYKGESGKATHFQAASNSLQLPNSVYDEANCETVPFYFCFLLIVLYMLSGAFVFYVWEGWSILDGAYFCFVTLSTIGFGDIIPERTLSSNQTESKKRIILIVIYIIGGMTLIAMSFNIIYEQLAYKFRNIGARFQLRTERSHNGNGRDIKIVSNKFINSAEDIDV